MSKQWNKPPEMNIDPKKKYTATLTTDKGEIVLELFAEKTPRTVNNFVFLANQGFYDNLNARQNLSFYAELAEVPSGVAKERIEKLIDMVGLGAKRDVKVRAYSRGMKQRLGIAQSLVRDPKILILDEPTQGIDPEGTRDFRELIRMLSKEKGMTIIFTTHVLYEINKLCDRVAIMMNGKIAGIGTIPELRKQVNATEGEDFEQVFLRYQGVV